MGLQVRLLGRLEVVRDSVDVTPSPRRLRGLIALLALTPGRPVDVDLVVEGLWGLDPPNHPSGALATYVKRLRSCLGEDAIATEARGYSLVLGTADVDAVLIGHLVGRARQAQMRGDLEAEDQLLRNAISLWRGAPLIDVDLPELRLRETPRFEECYLAACERVADIDAAAGRVDQSLDLLNELVSTWPLRESSWSRLLRALHGLGRRVEALDRYEYARNLFSEKLGSDPGADLQAVHAELLAESTTEPVRTSAKGASACEAGPPPPHQLPRDLPGFTGRNEEIQLLDDVSGCDGLAAISGPPGVGKTALALHWAHQNARRFPGGQMYIDLRGFDRDGRVMSPGDALRTLIAGLAPQEVLPTSDEGLVARWRTLTADASLLVVLDNARDTDQVRPLFPAGQRCFSLVTSRSTLGGLIASENARTIPLEPVSQTDAAQLLASRIGWARVDGAPEAAGRLAAHCAGLPLAVALVGARVASRPQLPLNDLVAELAAAPNNLGFFDVDGTDLRSTFSWSCLALSPAAVRCFRLLGLHPGPDISIAAATSLVGAPQGETRALLSELAQAHLVREHSAGHYVMHDLLRAYAAEQAATSDRAERDEATGRLIEHYLHTSRAAVTHFQLTVDELLPTPPSRLSLEGMTLSLRDRHEALNWFRSEWCAIVALVEAASSQPRLQALVPGLVQTLGTYLELDGHWQAWEHCADLGLEVATRTNDVGSEAELRVSAAGAAMYQGRSEEALTHLGARKLIIESRGDKGELARVTYQIGLALAHHGDLSEAFDVTMEAAEQCRRVGNAITEAMCYTNAAEILMNLESYAAALDMCEIASTTWGGRVNHNVAAVWIVEGTVRLRRGEPELAVTPLCDAVAEYRSNGFAAATVEALTLRGDAYRAIGDISDACTDWSDALDALHDPSGQEAAELRDKLASTADISTSPETAQPGPDIG